MYQHLLFKLNRIDWTTSDDILEYLGTLSSSAFVATSTFLLLTCSHPPSLYPPTHILLIVHLRLMPLARRGSMVSRGS